MLKSRRFDSDEGSGFGDTYDNISAYRTYIINRPHTVLSTDYYLLEFDKDASTPTNISSNVSKLCTIIDGDTTYLSKDLIPIIDY